MPQHIICVGALDTYSSELRSRGVTVTVLGVKGWPRLPGAVLRVARIIRSLKPGVVQGWMYHGNILAAVAHLIAGRRETRRLFWNLRASNMDAVRYGRVMRACAALSRLPDLVIANSSVGMDFHVDRGFRPRRRQVIGNGVDTEKFRPDPQRRAAGRGEFGIAPDTVVAIHVARVDRMKDHDTLLAALRSIPQVRTLLVGANTETLPLPGHVRGLGVRRDIEQIYPLADIVVSSSAYGEGFSNVIAEGMSAGLVPIATDVGDARVIVGETGAVVPPSDAAALAEALAAAAAELPQEREARGLRARARIVERFPLQQTIEAYASLYTSYAAKVARPLSAPVSAA